MADTTTATYTARMSPKDKEGNFRLLSPVIKSVDGKRLPKPQGDKRFTPEMVKAASAVSVNNDGTVSITINEGTKGRKARILTAEEARKALGI